MHRNTLEKYIADRGHIALPNIVELKKTLKEAIEHYIKHINNRSGFFSGHGKAGLGRANKIKNFLQVAKCSDTVLAYLLEEYSSYSTLRKDSLIALLFEATVKLINVDESTLQGICKEYKNVYVSVAQGGSAVPTASPEEIEIITNKAIISRILSDANLQNAYVAYQNRCNEL